MAASCQKQATERRQCSGNENEKAVLSAAGGKEQDLALLLLKHYHQSITSCEANSM